MSISNQNTRNQSAQATLSHPSEESRAEEEVLGQYIPLLYHYNMLQDEDRVGAFRDAIDLTVRPGMHVVELGGGTGVLSSFAARRGARVTCVERNPELVATSRRFLAANGLAELVNVVHADAAEYVPSEPVDVVVCEMLHVGLLREKQTEVIHSFKQNYRRAMNAHSRCPVALPVFLPEVSILMVQLVEQSFDFAGYHAPVPMFQAPTAGQTRTIELSDLHPYANLAYDEAIPTRFAAAIPIQLRCDGHVNAIRLVTQNVLTIDEPAQRAITWANQCLVLPLEKPLDCEAATALTVAFDYAAGGAIEELSQSLQVDVVATVTN
ncbi:methyltransferase domain-containing protein [Aporhodopirellula aestuarii]|uniref:Methyltransferase domain-containing protein n=1 Tax=Aporhodopirellula aestuarii TaxID=2950107 RepID=A0ABT0U4I6_9BACT|nr:methyltransferase domain-containing protein [Aporhodopirellula aestuarii]MCM2371834.1 methyltransferase domain-containing protein [Aporhodopirellula aestuarii]